MLANQEVNVKALPRPITWSPFLWDQPKTASPADIEAVEAKLGARVSSHCSLAWQTVDLR